MGDQGFPREPSNSPGSQTSFIAQDSEKTQIQSLISEGGVFSKEERHELTSKYLPRVLPETVPATVIEGSTTKKLPKSAVVVRTFDPSDRKVDTVLRTKDAFLQ
ncbi:hypothetical protein JCM33374_g4499 [Metschnikowia sp. JCM 33374]|nr:hypothetical protein JCM33374_g4499 [Metschnikowia sp. JCM 33374]